MRILPDHPLSRRQLIKRSINLIENKKTLQTYLAVQQLQQSTLPGAVRPDQSQPGVQIDTEFQVFIDPGGVVGILEADVLHHDNRRRNRATAREIKRDYFIVGHFLGQALSNHFG